MANSAYDDLWKDAIGDLAEQLHVEGVNMTDEELANAPKDVSIFQAFQHFACLYIKYLQIYDKLENCYDGMLHPQKRIHVKKVLELTIKRIIELKGDLVKWNPPNMYLKMPGNVEEAFPWEYIHLDDILVDLKLSPNILDIRVPRYFREDNDSLREQRDRLVTGYMRLKHNTDEVYIPDKFSGSSTADAMTLENAIDIIQRNERGRQGIERASMVKDVRIKEQRGRGVYDASGQQEMDKFDAAQNIQRMFKGLQSRNAATKERENELMFIGMKQRNDEVEKLSMELKAAHKKRKQEQIQNKEIYEKSLDEMKVLILDEEGPEQREQLREERTLWITDQIAQDKFPEDLEGYYESKKFVLGS